jgi:hypothetical protein
MTALTMHHALFTCTNVVADYALPPAPPNFTEGVPHTLPPTTNSLAPPWSKRRWTRLPQTAMTPLEIHYASVLYASRALTAPNGATRATWPLCSIPTRYLAMCSQHYETRQKNFQDVLPRFILTDQGRRSSNVAWDSPMASAHGASHQAGMLAGL